ncbi:MAG: hypothetical protein AAGD10_21270 [Myxococcota bacterium]
MATVPTGDAPEDRLSHAGSGGLFYSARADLALGLEFSYLGIPTDIRDVNLELYEGRFIIQYFW